MIIGSHGLLAAMITQIEQFALKLCLNHASSSVTLVFGSGPF